MKNSILKKVLISLIVSGGLLIPLQSHAKPYHAIMVTNGGKLRDHSFNENTYNGFLMAKHNFNIQIHYMLSHGKESYLPNFKTASDSGGDLIMGIGSEIEKAIQKSAKIYPKHHFVVIDVNSSKDDILPNLTSVTYKIEQAGYLAGIVAGNMTYKYYKNSNKLNDKKILGVILGTKNPPVEAYVGGYIAGVRSVDSRITILLSTINTFTDDKKAELYADRMIDQGADIILPVVGDAISGAIRSAKRHNSFVIGVDRDENINAPSTVLVSLEKNITHSVYTIVRKGYMGGKLPQHISLGLKEGGVQLSQFHQFIKIIPRSVQGQVFKMKRKIIKGDLIIPNTIKKAFAKK